MHISLAAEKLFSFGPIIVTNSILATWIVMAILILLALSAGSNVKIIPGKLQNTIEAVLETLFDLINGIAGENARKFFPLVATFFIFILFSNWLGLLPGFNTIGLEREINGQQVFVPFFRGATADLNTTLALAIISMFAVEYYGFKSLGIKYGKKFFNFKNPILTFVGILELISECAKVISFTFRLYGNIFAGEVLLAVIAFLIPVLVPAPFFFLEIFVGLIQALVFTLLSTVFLTIAVTSHEEETAKNID